MKIVIVGGGTAGWLAALMISKIQKTSHELTLIESSKIGIIGAGEGSTGHLTDIIQGNSWDYGCDEEEFLKETGATIKLGIEHRDWMGKGTSYFGPIDGTQTSGQSPDVMLCHAMVNDIPVHTMSLNGYLLSENKTNYWYEEGKLTNTRGNAYHFDGHKVGKYFKKVATKNNVKHIDSEVLDITINENGIESLLLSNGETITADFFIDCSGFARKLMKALDIKWTSYQKNLPVNSAMPFLIDYKQDEEISSTTLAWAHSAGWMWKIPTGDRYGCGYVYDSNFISDDEAKKEIETTLGHEIEPIKYIKFDTGRLDKLWYKNCLAIGLAGAFAEPLEATSIHSTIIQLSSFIFDYLKDTREETVNTGSQNIYNRRMTQMYDDFKDFLVLHYQTKRTDSKFWQWINTGETKTDFVTDIIKMSKTKIPQPVDFKQYYGYAGSPLWNWILYGLGHINKASAEKELKFYGVNMDLASVSYKLYTADLQEKSSNMVSNSNFIKR
jgi:tryptophan halogenase